MDQVAGLDASDRAALKAMSVRSDAKGLGQLARHVGLIAATGALVLFTRDTAFVWPATALHGVVVVFLFCAVHESIHRTAFASPRLNALVANVCGFIVVLPPVWFRAFHLAHHRHTQIPGEDPELEHKRADTWSRYLIHVSGLPYWWSACSGLITRAAGRVPDRFMAEHLKPDATREARLFLAGYLALALGSIAFGTTVLLTYWIVPLMLGQPALRLYLLAEHGLCPFVGDPFENTRTTLTTRFVRLIAWNMPYHSEHHAFMAVPFHALPQVHDRFAGRIKESEDGYIAFNARYIDEVLLR
jgi:fatty acid desaturase